MFDRGVLSYDDCYVLAQIYINRCPRVKSILRKRFKYVFIDETQDLQEHQLEIMDQLFCDDSVCFQRIGDVNQSISMSVQTRRIVHGNQEKYRHLTTLCD